MGRMAEEFPRGGHYRMNVRVCTCARLHTLAPHSPCRKPAVLPPPLWSCEVAGNVCGLNCGFRLPTLSVFLSNSLFCYLAPLRVPVPQTGPPLGFVWFHKAADWQIFSLFSQFRAPTAQRVSQGCPGSCEPAAEL